VVLSRSDFMCYDDMICDVRSIFHVILCRVCNMGTVGRCVVFCVAIRSII
jgi:hypothetical protein